LSSNFRAFFKPLVKPVKTSYYNGKLNDLAKAAMSLKQIEKILTEKLDALRLARPSKKEVYRHLGRTELERILRGNTGLEKGAMLATDSAFSMKGDYAPLDRVVEICTRYETAYKEGIMALSLLSKTPLHAAKNCGLTVGC
jgi:hypothetical protein